MESICSSNRKENICPKKTSANKLVRLFFSLAETDRELTGHVKRDISENKFYLNLHQSMLVFCQRHTFLIMITTETQNDKEVLPLTIFYKNISYSFNKNDTVFLM